MERNKRNKLKRANFQWKVKHNKCMHNFCIVVEMKSFYEFWCWCNPYSEKGRKTHKTIMHTVRKMHFHYENDSLFSVRVFVCNRQGVQRGNNIKRCIAWWNAKFFSLFFAHEHTHTHATSSHFLFVELNVTGAHKLFSIQWL